MERVKGVGKEQDRRRRDEAVVEVQQVKGMSQNWRWSL